MPLPGGEAIGERGVLGSLPIPTPTLISLYPPSSFLQPPPCSPIPPPHKSLTLREPLSIFFLRIKFINVFPNEAQLRGIISAPLTSHSISLVDLF